MCGRYGVHDIKLAEPELTVTFDFKPNYNVAPTHLCPVITDLESHKIQAFHWGLIPSWSKDGKLNYSTINARSEEVFDKPLYKGPVRKKRCLVLANHYYEWHKPDSKTKIPYLIKTTDQPLMSFAGIWDQWTNKDTGHIINSFSILTTSPPQRIGHIHDRMPVILPEELKGQWLKDNLSDAEIKDLFLTYPEKNLKAYPVSAEVGKVKVNNPTLLEPIGDPVP